MLFENFFSWLCGGGGGIAVDKAHGQMPRMRIIIGTLKITLKSLWLCQAQLMANC